MKTTLIRRGRIMYGAGLAHWLGSDQSKRIMDTVFSGILTSSDEDCASLLSRLFIGSQFSSDSSMDIDFHNIFDSILSNALNKENKHNRTLLYRTIEQIIQSPKGNDIGKRLSHFIDRLPSLIESSTEAVELNSLCNLITSMVTHSNEESIAEMMTSIQRVVPKLTFTLCRLCSQEMFSRASLGLLETLLSSSYRNLLVQNIVTVRDTSFIHLNNPILRNQAANVLSLSYMLDSPESWQSSWIEHNENLIKLVQSISIKVSAAKDHALSSHESSQDEPALIKAIRIERLFSGYMCLLSKMLVNGCSSGPVEIDLSGFLSIISSILSLTVSVDPTDARISIENDKGMSAAALALIIVPLKIASLDTLECLLESQHPSLLKAGQSVCRLLTNVLTSSDVRNITSIAIPAFECFALTVKNFPTIVSRQPMFGVNVVVDMLRLEINMITSENTTDTSMQPNKTLLKQKNPLASDMKSNIGPELIMKVTETILTYCGSLLPAPQRDTIDEIINQGLQCLCKGVLLPQLSDRHVQRMPVEILRQSTRYQHALLALALSDALAFKQTGTVGGILPMLKRAAHCCVRQEATSSISMQILLTIDMMLHPSRIVLPSTPAIIDAKNYLSKVSEYIENVKINKSSESKSSSVAREGDAIVPDSSNFMDSMEETKISAEANIEKKRKWEDTKEMDEAKDVNQGETLESNQSDNLISNKKAHSTENIDEITDGFNTEMANESSKQFISLSSAATIADDDDDSLPDINTDGDIGYLN